MGDGLLKVKDSFGVQAAKFSLYTPLVVVVLNVLVAVGVNQKNVVENESMRRLTNQVIGGVSAFLMLTGFVMGLVALWLMRRYGRKGILGRAAGGVALNVFFVVMAVWGALWLSGSRSKGPVRIDHSLTTKGYVQLGLPEAGRPWTSGDFEKAAQVLAGIEDRHGLPRRNSPASGAMFARMTSKENLDYLKRLDVFERFAELQKIGVQVYQLIKVYTRSANLKADYSEEMADLAQLQFQWYVQVSRDLKAMRDGLDIADPRRQEIGAKIIEAESKTDAELISQSLQLFEPEIGGKGAARDELNLRVVEHVRELALALVGDMTPEARRKVVERVKHVRGRVTDEALRRKLEELQKELEAAK